MGTSTPLIDRIRDRRPDRVGPLCPTPISKKMSPFARRLAEKQLAVKELWLHDSGPDGTPAA